MALVTAESLDALATSPKVGVHAIGRALVVLFHRQTSHEQAIKSTEIRNCQGFTHADARQGLLTALYYLKHSALEEWQINMWCKRDRRGRTRIGKYHTQLNEAAIAKREAKTAA